LKNIAVLFENDQCIVLNKPSRLAVQGGKGVGTSLDARLAAEYSPRPLLVHRLDRDASGVILVAKSKEAAALFSGLFARRGAAKGAGITKRYLAVCSGPPEAGAGTIETEIDVRGTDRKALTYYKCLRPGEFSLLELELVTGRMHQIRRHLASIGNPILGDNKYGNFSLNKRLRKERGLKRMLLHSSRLIIPEGLCGFPLDVSAPLPEYFGPFLEGMPE
jgi:23S rRNA pseudouridine955/2504/2580 synthase